jgi:hypothetical protein
MKEKIMEVSEERLAICRSCPFHSSNFNSIRPDEHCTDCGCSLILKTKCLSCACPQSKWVAELTPEEEAKFKSDEEI